MLTIFKPKHHSILGIDIGSSSIKVLELSGSKENLCVEAYGRERLPPDALDGNTIKDVELVSQCIKKLIARTRLTTKNVALAVPDSAVISKIVQINDGLSEEEMEEVVLIEADKFIPYPINEVNLDFEVFGPSPKNAAILDVLIVASRAENVSTRVNAATLAGLDVKIVDIESYAVERAAQQLVRELPAGGQDKIAAIIDIGSKISHLHVLHGNKIIFTREERFGSLQLLESIAEHYKMSHDQARIARNEGQLPEDYVEDVLIPFKETLLLQIKRTLQFFYSTEQHGSLDHIFLGGGIAREQGMVEFIQEQLGVVTTVANPLAYMSFNSTLNQEAIVSDAPSLMVACGLALRHIE